VLIDGVGVDYRQNALLKQGQRILLRTPGGGGAGSPRERDRAAAERDLREGYTVLGT
jgi:N-methylhydantoinase B/oxoprolinase/acetone carboxylase alpha subunit